MITRIVGGKGIELSVEMAQRYGLKLVVAGERKGYASISLTGLSHVQYLGRVDEKKKWELMAGAKAFLGLSRDEDFGISLVEAQLCGTPVIAFNDGGYRESVIDGKTGVLFEDYSAEGLHRALGRFERLKWNSATIIRHAKQFLPERFEKQMLELVNTYARATGN